MLANVKMNPRQHEAWIALHDDHTREVLFGGGARGGKAQPLYSKVLTTFGWKKMGDMVVGDELVSPSGGTTTVIAIHPQGPKDIYEIEMVDGGITHATEDHLWDSWKSRRQGSRKVRTTKQLKEILDKRDRYHILLPSTTNTDFGEKRYRMLDPYILGCLLGDGGMTGSQTTITTADAEIVKYFEEKLPEGMSLTKQGKYTYGLKGGCESKEGHSRSLLTEYLACLGVRNRCDHKFIPVEFLRADRETRLEVLRGLMDTDGTVDMRGSCTFTSKSKQLAEDVRTLVFSLGGKGTVSETRKSCVYKGERKWGIYYNVYISISPDVEIFRLERKKARLKKKLNDTSRRIKSITFLEHYPAQCITVDKEDGLYITDDYIVTHNSWFGCQWIILEALSKPGSAWLIGRDELKKLKQTTLLTFFEVINSLGLRDEIKYNEPMGMIYFKKQDVHIFLVDLSYQPSDPKYNRLGSYSLTGYFIDEAQEVRKDAIDILRARTSLLSGADDEGNKWQANPKSLYTCNPDKGWIYHDFWKPYKNNILTPDRCFIPALVSDNTLIPKRDRDAYIENLRKSDKVTVERMLYGNFDYDDTPNRMFEYDKMLDMWGVNEKRRGRKYITCDVSRLGGDMCVIYVWDGYVLEEVLKFKNERLTYTEEKIRELAKKYLIPMSRVLVDEDGVGGGLVDNLKCRGFTANLTPISPLSKKYLPEKRRNYANLKTQCYDILAQRVKEGMIYINDTAIRETLIEELDVMCYIDVDKESRIKITSKETSKGLIGRSPDFADALSMRFFFDLYMSDADFEEYGIYDPHKNEDMYGNMKSMEQSIDEFLAKARIQGNTYQAKEAISIY